MEFRQMKQSFEYRDKICMIYYFFPFTVFDKMNERYLLILFALVLSFLFSIMTFLWWNLNGLRVIYLPVFVVYIECVYVPTGRRW